MTDTDCSFKNLEDSLAKRKRDTGLRESFGFTHFKEANDCPVLPGREKGTGRLKKQATGVILPSEVAEGMKSYRGGRDVQNKVTVAETPG